jgi:hypothetical protein
MLLTFAKSQQEVGRKEVETANKAQTEEMMHIIAHREGVVHVFDDESSSPLWIFSAYSLREIEQCLSRMRLRVNGKWTFGSSISTAKCTFVGRERGKFTTYTEGIGNMKVVLREGDREAIIEADDDVLDENAYYRDSFERQVKTITNAFYKQTT